MPHQTKRYNISRRRFLKTAGAATAISLIPEFDAAGESSPLPASEKLNIAGIGVGGMGATNLRNLEGENIVALCDVDPVYTAKTAERYPKARLFNDYRVMFEEQKDIDAVVIATPDHTHAAIAMAAMSSGKHVYCQKPLTHDIYEARTLSEAARKSDVTTVMGIQGHSGEGI
jgi:predicted dehydrogenase